MSTKQYYLSEIPLTTMFSKFDIQTLNPTVGSNDVMCCATILTGDSATYNQCDDAIVHH